MVQMLFRWQSQENVSKYFLKNMPMSYSGSSDVPKGARFAFSMK